MTNYQTKKWANPIYKELYPSNWRGIPNSLQRLIGFEDAGFFVYLFKIWADFKDCKQFTKSQEAMSLELNISVSKIKRKCKFLIDKGYVIREFKRGVNWYNINLDKVKSDMSEEIEEYKIKKEAFYNNERKEEEKELMQKQLEEAEIDNEELEAEDIDSNDRAIYDRNTHMIDGFDAHMFMKDADND